MTNFYYGKPGETEVIRRLKETWFFPKVRSVFQLAPVTNQKTVKTVELPSFKALGKDGLCRLLFDETRLLYQLLTANLVK